MKYLERITTKGRNVDYKRSRPPVDCQVADADKGRVRKEPTYELTRDFAVDNGSFHTRGEPVARPNNQDGKDSGR